MEHFTDTDNSKTDIGSLHNLMYQMWHLGGLAITMHNITKSYCLYDFSTCDESKVDDGTTIDESSYEDLVSNLTETHPNPKYGYFESYAHALYCKDCQMILYPKFANRIPCKSLEIVVCEDGTWIYIHAKCEKLDLTEHVRSTMDKCGDWKKTYWRLWSECHFLSCATCKQPYPVKNSAMCIYHPKDPEFIPIGNLNLKQPIGRYPCCGELTFRFQVIKNPFGCKFRMHVPNMKNDRDVQIKEIMRKYPKLTIVEPSTLNYDRNITKLASLDLGTKIPNPLYWCEKVTLGENYLVDTSIMPSIWKLIGTDKKQANFKDLNKRKKKIHSEISKLSELNSKQTNLNASTDSKNLQGNAEIAENYYPTSSNEELEFTRHSFNKEHSWKMVSIQDLQIEQESAIFNHMAIKFNKAAKVENPPRDCYTAIHAKMLEKINTNEIQQKSTKSTKLP